MTSADYYDEYADRQVKVGVNDRHRAIRGWLERFGLEPGMEVLEIGCGIGTQTQLIAESLKGTGSLLAIDPSPRSIELARARLAKWRNVRCVVADAVDLKLDRTFDVIVMADVIEHIPIEQHGRLFANTRRWLKDTGWILIHIPNPFYLEWCRRNRPDLLQLVDQAIFVDTLLAGIGPSALYVHYLNTYSIWVPEGDYQVIVLKPRLEAPDFHVPEGSSSPSGSFNATKQRVLRVASHLVRSGRWRHG